MRTYHIAQKNSAQTHGDVNRKGIKRREDVCTHT